jgi:putative transposase
MISFKGAHFPKDIILYAVFFYVRYGVSYRDLEEIMGERGVKVDHATLNRWVIDYSSLIAAEAKNTIVPLRHPGGWMKPTLRSKANGFICIELSINSVTLLISCFPNVEMKPPLPPFSNKPSTLTGFLTKSSWISGANYAGLENINILLMLAGLISFVEILQVK